MNYLKKFLYLFLVQCELKHTIVKKHLTESTILNRSKNKASISLLKMGHVKRLIHKYNSNLNTFVSNTYLKSFYIFLIYNSYTSIIKEMIKISNNLRKSITCKILFLKVNKLKLLLSKPLIFFIIQNCTFIGSCVILFSIGGNVIKSLPYFLLKYSSISPGTKYFFPSNSHCLKGK